MRSKHNKKWKKRQSNRCYADAWTACYDTKSSTFCYSVVEDDESVEQKVVEKF